MTPDIRFQPGPEDARRDDDEQSQSSSETDDEDQTWDDWVSDSDIQPCKSLFDDEIFKTVEQAVVHDKEKYGFDLSAFSTKLGLDIHERIRLINFIRKTTPSADKVLSLGKKDPLFSSDEYLKPVLEDDPLLQFQDDDWSDSEDELDAADPTRRIAALEKKLERTKAEFEQYRKLIGKRMELSRLAEDGPDEVKQPLARDDDTHYFKSYGENDIHAVMIQDQVRTSSYAHFIMKNPNLFREATVLDVGCGTGILSLFAAKAGAKRVFAVDASDIAERAKEIVKLNGLESVITVIRGKVEDIKLPDDVKHVDVIISEWMGYALLYESMLDSVLHARDRFLNPEGGVMAPTQCRMMFSLCDASDLVKDRVSFWNDVYGFDLSPMADDIAGEAIVDVLASDKLLSKPVLIKDLHLGDITPRQLDFSSSFSLISIAERKTKMHAFILYFDTFFTVTGQPVPRETEVKVIRTNDMVLGEVWPVGGKPAPQRRQSQGGKEVTSFSTGPQSIPTHWKQTFFLLKDPFIVEEGTVVEGQFHCKKSHDNSRELDVEIHYSIRPTQDAPPGEVIVRMFKVR